MNRFCLTCKYEPDWNGRIGKCKLVLKKFGEHQAVDISRYFNPDEVIVHGNSITNCLSWEQKESEYISCPWCKSTNIEVASSGEEIYSAFCDNCGAQGPTGISKKDAKELWNNR